jgi:hypothetical protein
VGLGKAEARGSAESLVGRRKQCGAIDRLIAAARRGQSGVLVVEAWRGVHLGLRRLGGIVSAQSSVCPHAGHLTLLPFALDSRAGAQVFAGNLTRAGAILDELAAVNDAIDIRHEPYSELALAAMRGREDEATRVLASRMDDFLVRGEGMGVTLAHWATAALHNGLAHYEQALAAAEEAAADPHELWFSGWGLVELVEAAARTGKTDR